MEEKLLDEIVEWDWEDSYFATSLPIKIKKNKETAKIPEQGSQYAAGYDVFACLDQMIEILPHQTIKIDTGLSIQVPVGYWIGVFARSGLATKEGLRPANCVGE